MLNRYEPLQSSPKFSIRHFDKEIKVVGDPKQANSVIVEGSLDSNSMVAHYYNRAGKLVAVAALNRNEALDAGFN